MIESLNDYFDYITLQNEFCDDEINQNIISLQNEFAKKTKSWNSELNSEWIIREYIAVKMILSSTVLLSSVIYANKKNLRIVEPYLSYYSLLNCSRCVVLTSPFHNWSNGEILTMTHKKTINIVGDILAKYNKEKGQETKKIIDNAREYRELFSYKFPAEGLSNHDLNLEKTIEICKLLCEISQLQSKILENSLTKNVKEEYMVNWNTLQYGFNYEDLIDLEDGYRLHKIASKQKRPYSLHLTMNEGMVMDFMGAWHHHNENDDDLYNPDIEDNIIFPCP